MCECVCVGWGGVEEGGCSPDGNGTAGSVTDWRKVWAETRAHSQLKVRGFSPHRSLKLNGIRTALNPSACAPTRPHPSAPAPPAAAHTSQRDEQQDGFRVWG